MKINEKSQDTERTLLVLTCLSGKTKLVQYILSTHWNEKIDIDARDNKYKTALMWACHYGYKAIVKDLCHHGADVTPVDKEKGYNALMLACINGHHEVVEILLDQPKIDLKATDNIGRNALFLANKEQQNECIRVIAECGSL